MRRCAGAPTASAAGNGGQHLLPELARGGSGGPAGQLLTPPGRGSPHHDRGGQPAQLSGEPRRSVGAERGRQQVGDGDRLDDDRHRGSPGQHGGAGQQPPDRRRPPDQPWVNGPHLAPESTGCAAAERAGGMCAVEMRLRNTQYDQA